MLKKDSLPLGMVLGLLLPGILFGLLFLLNSYLSNRLTQGRPILSMSSMGLIAVFLNMFLMRMYLLRWKFDKTGRGILVVTFVLAIIIILLFFK